MSVFDRSGNTHRAVFTRAAAAVTATGDTGAFANTAKMLAVDLRVSAVGGTSPSLTPRVDRLGTDGLTWYTIWTGTAMTAVGNQIVSIGPGLGVTHLPTGQLRVGWTVTGTSPTLTLAVSVQGV